MTEMPRNRWFQLDDSGRPLFRFGKYRGDLLEEVISTADGEWYVRNVMLKFDDMTPEMHDFLSEVLEEESVPVSAPPPPGPERRFDKEVRFRLLQEKARSKLKAAKTAKVADEAKEVLEKRREESEW